MNDNNLTQNSFFHMIQGMGNDGGGNQQSGLQSLNPNHLVSQTHRQESLKSLSEDYLNN